MSIRIKITLAFLLMAAFLVIQSVVATRTNDRLRGLVELAIDKNYNAVSGINSLVNEMQKLRRYEKEYFIYITDVVKKERYARQWQTTFDQAQTQLAEMIRNPNSVYNGNDVLTFSNWKDALMFYGTEFQKILVMYKTIAPSGMGVDQEAESPSIQANAMIRDGKTRLGKALAAAGSTSRIKTRESLEVVAEVENNFRMVSIISLSLTVAAVLLAVILIFVVPGGINQTLGRLLGDAERISQGDISKPVERSPVPEFDSLARSLETIRRSMLADSQRREANTHQRTPA